MSNETYNGWTNRETWLVNLWGFTESYDHDELEIYRDNPYALSKELESSVEAHIDAAVGDLEGFAGDLFGGAIARINYYELAESLLADLPEQEDETLTLK